ncbi:polyadenylate-binding protein-interacting protein 6 [Andrographis paniculata]|uniref:polyadenylate-binding protein-interacting protein 6 n=1 Tax=Andrographis paniculata TaxID=175694 RepID=UPI0021E8FFB4|nr:polyadenylate-binding protein-interacting protein 6 [Andrographis paniculata]XP_051151523.1 polyadenylate-binding protein-interacting protein 6 [Andrographis paniculata]
MKTGASSLNPYAASYVPLFKRGAAAAVGTKDFSKSRLLNNVSDVVWYGHQPDYASGNGDFTKRNDHHADEFYASPSHHPMMMMNDNQEFMDLAYLQMTFPCVSKESLSDVYFANGCDLDASIDMLDLLETYSDDHPSYKLPDTLDIGDVPDSFEAPSQSPAQEQWSTPLLAKAKTSTPGSSSILSSLS